VYHICYAAEKNNLNTTQQEESMTKQLTFSHPGTFGDTLYSMCPVKILGGGDVYVKLNGMNEVAWNAFGAPNAGVHAGRYTQADIDFLFPLLEKQSYIHKLDLWRNEIVDYDLGDHYKFTTGPTGWQGNQTECAAMVCGLDLDKHRRALLIDPWLDPVEPIRIDNRSIVINRTSRYLQGGDPNAPTWRKWVEDGLDDVAVFLGTQEEADAFNRQFGCNVPYHKVEDMLEMARIIQGAEQVMANQSIVMALAIGLGKTFWCETRKDYDNYRSPRGWGDVWFPRVNGFYF
jgi:hypothetical protein